MLALKFVLSSSQLLRDFGLAPFPQEKLFILPTVRDAEAIVVDETIVGLSLGPKIAFYSLETGMLTSEMVVPGVRQYGQEIENILRPSFMKQCSLLM